MRTTLCAACRQELPHDYMWSLNHCSEFCSTINSVSWGTPFCPKLEDLYQLSPRETYELLYSLVLKLEQADEDVDWQPFGDLGWRTHLGYNNDTT